MGGDGTLESSVDGRLASIFEHFDTMLTQCCLSSVTTLHWPIASHFLCVPMWVVWEKMAWTSHIKVQDVLIAQKWAKIFSLEIFKIGKVKCGTKHLPFSASKNAHAHPPPKKVAQWGSQWNAVSCHHLASLHLCTISIFVDAFLKILLQDWKATTFISNFCVSLSHHLQIPLNGNVVDLNLVASGSDK